MDFLAVYGTLKRGYGNHRLIYTGQLEYYADAVSEDRFHLVGGGFPILYTNPGIHRVAVELYSFTNESQLEAIDRLEGHPEWYRRERRNFITGNQKIFAWVYLQPSKNLSGALHPTIHVSEEGVAKWIR